MSSGRMTFLPSFRKSLSESLFLFQSALVFHPCGEGFGGVWYMIALGSLLLVLKVSLGSFEQVKILFVVENFIYSCLSHFLCLKTVFLTTISIAMMNAPVLM